MIVNFEFHCHKLFNSSYGIVSMMVEQVTLHFNQLYRYRMLKNKKENKVKDFKMS